MKLGVYGDSWIDICGYGTRVPDERYAYPALVKQNLNADADFYGYYGTSHWYSFEKFLQTYKKYDAILFVHPGHVRWPSLPVSETGNNYDIYPNDNIFDIMNPLSNNKSDFMSNINKFFLDILPEELLVFLSKSIYDKVNSLCKEKNIYLVNIMPFERPYDITNTAFPFITDLIHVSNKEKTNHNGKKILTSKLIRDSKIPDPRVCHLNFKNNRSLANIISKLIEQKAENKHIDGRIYLTEYEDVENDKWIQEQLNEKNISDR